MAVLATETASATAGREGKATSPDGKINLQLSPPGSNGPGTNPEQLFAAGYSACFGGAIGAAASLAKVPLKMADIKVTATVRLHKEESGFFIDATLDAELARASTSSRPRRWSRRRTRSARTRKPRAGISR